LISLASQSPAQAALLIVEPLASLQEIARVPLDMKAFSATSQRVSSLNFIHPFSLLLSLFCLVLSLSHTHLDAYDSILLSFKTLPPPPGYNTSGINVETRDFLLQQLNSQNLHFAKIIIIIIIIIRIIIIIIN
jgi:hypothetical protein